MQLCHGKLPECYSVTLMLPVAWLQAPLFTMKADLFKDSLFVVGYDTAVRLVRADYYGDETAMLLQVRDSDWAPCLRLHIACQGWWAAGGACPCSHGPA